MRRNRALGVVLVAMLFVVGCGNAGRTLTGFSDTVERAQRRKLEEARRVVT